jgi:hypothetical protein
MYKTESVIIQRIGSIVEYYIFLSTNTKKFVLSLQINNNTKTNIF